MIGRECGVLGVDGVLVEMSVREESVGGRLEAKRGRRRCAFGFSRYEVRSIFNKI